MSLSDAELLAKARKCEKFLETMSDDPREFAKTFAVSHPGPCAMQTFFVRLGLELWGLMRSEEVSLEHHKWVDENFG